jgi:hypothetical protein
VCLNGAAYVFVPRGGAWTQQAKLTATDGAFDDNVGISVALSGSTAVIGAYGTNVYAGAASVYWRSGARGAPDSLATITTSERSCQGLLAVLAAVHSQRLRQVRQRGRGGG